MKKLKRLSLLAIALVLGCGIGAAAQIGEPPDHHDPSTLADEKIVAALKQVLELSPSKAIALTDRADGFLNNEAIRILLPTKLQSGGKAMRLIGEGDIVDDLEIDMNPDAERAAPQGQTLFLEALNRMDVYHASGTLPGGAAAAPEYFKRTSSADLTGSFTPIVHSSLQRVGVIKKYEHVVKTAPGGNAIANEFA